MCFDKALEQNCISITRYKKNPFSSRFSYDDHVFIMLAKYKSVCISFKYSSFVCKSFEF